jgi:hypothetical protein
MATSDTAFDETVASQACTAHWQLVQLLRVSTAGSTCTSTNRAETNPTRYSQTMLAAADVAATILFNSSGF